MAYTSKSDNLRGSCDVLLLLITDKHSEMDLLSWKTRRINPFIDVFGGKPPGFDPPPPGAHLNATIRLRLGEAKG